MGDMSICPKEKGIPRLRLFIFSPHLIGWRIERATFPFMFLGLLWASLMVATTTACREKPYILLDIPPQPIPSPDGYFQDVAWLEPGVLALEHLATPDTANWDTKLMILYIDTREYYLLPDEVPPACNETRYGRMSRLPNGFFGYLKECLPSQGIARDFRMHQWDQATQTDLELYRYPIPFEATAFSFDNDMERWLQEQSGDGLFNMLYLVEIGEDPVRVLENSFARVGEPWWMPDGRILFAGTPGIPQTSGNLFSGMPGITVGLREPWNIYLTSLSSLVDGTVEEEQIILSGVRYINEVKASPNGEVITFLGTVEGEEGLWALKVDNGELVRLWGGFGPYDWSPEGNELVVLVREPNAEFFYGKPARITLPDSLLN